MALDPVPTYPGNYDAVESNNNPPGNDSRREGDDQIRRMKASEKATWTNITGAVTASHTELNTLVGVDPSYKVVAVPTGAIALFELNTLNGWTKITSAAYNNVAMRISTGTITDTTYGNLDFDVVFSRTATDAHTLSESDIPAHDHGGGPHNHGLRYRDASGGATFNIGVAFATTDSASDTYTSSLFATASNSEYVENSGAIVTSFGSGGSHTHGNDMRVRYRDVCAFQKD